MLLYRGGCDKRVASRGGDGDGNGAHHMFIQHEREGAPEVGTVGVSCVDVFLCIFSSHATLFLLLFFHDFTPADSVVWSSFRRSPSFVFTPATSSLRRQFTRKPPVSRQVDAHLAHLIRHDLDALGAEGVCLVLGAAGVVGPGGVSMITTTSCLTWPLLSCLSHLDETPSFRLTEAISPPWH